MHARMLIVDSLWDSAIALERLMDICGWDVRTSNSAGEALRTAATFHPQLVLISMARAEELWLALAQRLRSDMGGEVHVVGLTTAFLASVEDETMHPFDAVLQKPLQLEDVRRLTAQLRDRMPDLVFGPRGERPAAPVTDDL